MRIILANGLVSILCLALSPAAVCREQTAEEILNLLAPLPEQQEALSRVDQLNGRAQSLPHCNSLVTSNLQNQSMICLSSQNYREQMSRVLVNSSTFILHDVSINTLPTQIKESLPKSILMGDVKRKIDLTITLGNDNLQMLGFGLIKDPKNKLGDDFFKTSTFGLRTSRELPENILGEGVTFHSDYTSDLYTTRKIGSVRHANGQTYDQQNFRNVDTLKFLADNIKAGKVFFWQAGAGVISVNSSHGIEKSVTQQHAWHELLNSIKKDTVAKHSNMNDDETEKLTGLVSAYMGLQKTFQLSEGCSVNLQGKIGGQWAGLGFSNAQASTRAEVRQNFSNGSAVSASLEAVGTLRNSGVGREVRAGIEYINPKEQAVGLMIIKNSGAQEAPAGFDSKNIFTGTTDPYFYAYWRTPLDR